MLLSLISLITAIVTGVSSSSQPATAPSLDHPCSFVTTADMSSMLGVPVSAATDEKFRCKYTVGNGWLETKLMDISLKMTRDIFDYNKTRGHAVAGVGDQAYVLGATMVSKLGDVVVVVDGSNMPKPPADATLKAVATRIVRRIP